MEAYDNITLLIEDAKEFKTNNFKRSLFLGLLQKHRLRCSKELCLCHKYIKVLNEKNLKNIDKKYTDDRKKKEKLYLDGDKMRGKKEHNLVNLL